MLSRRLPSFGAASTDNRLIYAIGDIHGRLDLLRDLMGQVAEDFARTPDVRLAPVLMFLGDYVDRGEQSRGVVDLLIALRDHSGFDVRCLKGNHEQTLLNFLGDAQAGPAWGQYGGRSTLASYGVKSPLGTDMEAWEAARLAFVEALPAKHLEFYTSLRLWCALGDYMFVHAGVRHGVPLEAQSEQDLLWIREPFLEETRPFDKLIVHGHSPTKHPYIGSHRICVDTGAYATGVLSAAKLFGADCTFLSTSQPVRSVPSAWPELNHKAAALAELAAAPA